MAADGRFVDTVNVALVFPAGTVTLAGTIATLLLLDMVTTAPPAGAGPLSVTVPCPLSPPRMVVGLTVIEARLSVGAEEIVRVACRVAPLAEAVMVAVALAVTRCVLIAKSTL